jgi:hypothetical protein
MYIKKQQLEALRRNYPVGCRVELLQMDDIQAPPIGTHGTVDGVDDIGSIMVSWDNGSGLSVVFGVDSVKKLDSVTVICYGKSKLWDDRKEAERFYFEAMNSTEGSERERYSNIYCDIISGKEVCKDESED